MTSALATVPWGMADITRFVRDIDSGWWKQAVEEHNKCRKSPKSSKYINLANPTFEALVTSQDLLESATRASKRAKSGTSKALLTVVHLLNKHSKAIDVFVNTTPFAAFVWGPVRVLLEAITDGSETSNIVAEGVCQVLIQIDRWRELSVLFAVSDRAQSAAVHLYTQVLDFLQSARKHYDNPTLKNWTLAVIDSRKNKFSGKLAKVKEAASELEKEIRLIVDHALMKLAQDTMTTLAGLRQTTETTRARLDELIVDARSVSREILLGRAGIESRIASGPQQPTQGQIVWHNLSRKLALQEWLGPKVPNSDSSTYVQGTCRWLLSQSAFIDTMEKDNGNLLFVWGPPGYGKSYLATWLKRELSSNPQGQSQVWFHKFEDGSTGPQQCSASGFVASLIQQIYNTMAKSDHVDTAVSLLEPLIRAYPLGAHTTPFNPIWDAFTTLVKTAGIAQPILIIDALDQCDFSVSQGVEIDTFMAKIKNACNLFKAKLVVFSRPRSLLRKFEDPGHIIEIHNSQAPHDDVMLFFESEYRRLRLDMHDAELVRDRTKRLADRSFLVVKWFLAYLRTAPTDESFYKMLEETPPKLWDLYEAMIHESSSKLNVGQIQCRNRILLLLVGTQAPITWKEISNALSLRGDSEEMIFELCGQLVTWAGDLLHFSHPTVKEFLLDNSRLPLDLERTILLHEDNSHALLTQKCLTCLMDNQYASKARIAQLFRGNFNEPALTTGIFPTREAMSYEYAARHWGYHLSKVPSPEPELLSIANDFLHSFQLVFWGEFAYRLARGNQNSVGNLTMVRADYGYLHEWFAKLSDESKSQIGIDDFFIDPYERISKSWATPPEDDKVLPWMPLIRLGDYCWEMALIDQGTKFRREARNGCIETLGSRHPLTLRSRRDMCQVFMIEGRYPDALDEYNAVVDAQRDVLGSDNPAVYETLSHRGITEFLVTRFDGAIQSETEASKGLLRLEGSESTLYIVSQWILTWPLSYTGDYRKALEISQDLFRRRREKHGRGDPYALSFGLVMGELFRKLDRMEESIQRLEEAFDIQRRALAGSISQNVGLLDPAINLVLSYRESGQNDKAWKLIGEIEGPEGELPDSFYDRQCQLTHVKGLLLSDEGKVNAAISLLQGFFVKVDRDHYNRAVLWLLLDLAAMLRARGEEGDEDQALINFQNILRKADAADISPIEVIGDEPGLEDDLTSEEEPDPPSLLHDAEHALTLVRNLKFAEAEMFLEEKQVEWYRQRDFWIIYGTVPADTTTMKPPSLEVVDEFISISYPERAKRCSLRQKPTHPNMFALRYYQAHIFPMSV